MIKRPKRSVQHKTQRDDRKSQEVDDLKAEIRLLRKQVSRLRKEAQKVPLAEEPETFEPVGKISKCDDCGDTNVTTLIIPTGSTLSVCNVCGKRKTIKKDEL